MKKITPEYINKQLKLSALSGYTYPTQLQLFQQSFSELIVQNELVNGGMIRSLEEINIYLAKKMKTKYTPWTAEKYNEEFSKLVDKLSSRHLSYKDIKSDIRRDIINTIENMYEATDGENSFNPIGYTTDELYNAFKEAWDTVHSKYGRKNGDTQNYFYDEFYKNLQALQEWRYR